MSALDSEELVLTFFLVDLLTALLAGLFLLLVSVEREGMSVIQ